MKFKTSPWHWLLVITLIHVAAIAYAVKTPVTRKIVVEPSIQGVLISIPKPEVLPQPPKPEKQKPKRHKHKPKHHKPRHHPKAPPSERAVKAPEPVPVEPPKEIVKEEPTEAQPAPVVPPSADAKELRNPAPPYPGMSRKLKEEGTVTLKVLVKADGRVEQIEIAKSSGYKRLDDAAKKAFKRWKFLPATQDGVAIDYWYEFDFEFSLRKK
jgi:periplasmic protein TonB